MKVDALKLFMKLPCTACKDDARGRTSATNFAQLCVPSNFLPTGLCHKTSIRTPSVPETSVVDIYCKQFRGLWYSQTVV